MTQYITLRIKSYGVTNEETETEVIYNGLDIIEARRKIKEDYDETIEYVEGDAYNFDDENSYVVDEDDDSIVTYAIHKVKLPEIKE